jgi:hypothetical protein
MLMREFAGRRPIGERPMGGISALQRITRRR